MPSKTVTRAPTTALTPGTGAASLASFATLAIASTDDSVFEEIGSNFGRSRVRASGSRRCKARRGLIGLEDRVVEDMASGWWMLERTRQSPVHPDKVVFHCGETSIRRDGILPAAVEPATELKYLRDSS
jgi:hypothetical protein